MSFCAMGRIATHKLNPQRPQAPADDPALIAEFTRRGISEKKILEVIAKVKPGQDVVAQLELGDHMIQHSHDAYSGQRCPGLETLHNLLEKRRLCN